MKQDSQRKIDSLESRPAKPSLEKKATRSRFVLPNLPGNIKFLPYAMIAIILIVIAGTLIWRQHGAKPKKQTAETVIQKQATSTTEKRAEKTDQIPESSDGKLPAYTIIQPVATSTPQATQKSPTQQAPLRITIITQDRNEQKLIALNDSLMKQYKSQIDPKRGFFIDYFDSKEVAAHYFETVANSKIDKSTKAELYKHYVAIMVNSEALKMNQLYLQGTPVKSLKQY